MIGGYIAKRGEKEYLRPHWEAATFDSERFDLICREHSRNDAVWTYRYWRHINGLPLASDTEPKKLVRNANRATGGVNQDGERERYMRKEALATIDQVNSYGLSFGIKPLVTNIRERAEKKRARGRKKSKHYDDSQQRLALALADVAEGCSQSRFTASTRQLGRMAGLSALEVCSLRHALERDGVVRKVGECKPYKNNTRGTTIWSIMPLPPSQRVDERRHPVFNPASGRWEWENKGDRGTTSASSWVWRFNRGLVALKSSKSPENSSVSDGNIPIASAFSSVATSLAREDSPRKLEESPSPGCASLARGLRPGRVPNVYSSSSPTTSSYIEDLLEPIPSTGSP